MKLSLTLLGFFALLLMMAQGDPIVPNGDFEEADPTVPGKAAHWDLTDGLGVRWTDAPNVPGAPPHGKAIRMDTSVTEVALNASYAKAGLTQWEFPNPVNGPIGYSYGVSLYSEAQPVVPGKTYRVTFDFMSPDGVGGKLWFRGYGDVNGQKKRLYEATIDCAGKATWTQFSGVFHPTRHTPNVTEFKIMLFTFIPVGVSWFDNVHLEIVDDPDPQ